MSRDALVPHGELTVTQETAAELPDGRRITRWTFGSPEGVTPEVLSLGARLQALHTPDRHGRCANVVLGCESTADLFGEAAYFGATVGRYANRIAGGTLPLNGSRTRASHWRPSTFRTRPTGPSIPPPTCARGRSTAR